jgi:Uncharacterized conserved protein related to C-terminal domain of eukaryotic chaperone, SACSIN
MKTSLSHLPQIKQEQILQAVKIIKEVTNPEKIILFGSYSSGKHVDDNYIENVTRYSYNSDFDFLVVTKVNDEKEFVLKDKIVNKTRTLFKTPVNPIIHSLEYVNEGLEIGQYFFSDIINDGISLYDNNSIPFSKPKFLTGQQKKEIAWTYFDHWFNSGKALLNSVLFNFNEKEYNLAAFELHQAAERFYNAVLLVYTNYKPKTHNLDILRQYAKNLSKELFLIFPSPTEDENESYLFELLKRSYIEARYKNDFTITQEELKILIERVTNMKNVTEKICLEKISEFNSL